MTLPDPPAHDTRPLQPVTAPPRRTPMSPLVRALLIAGSLVGLAAIILVVAAVISVITSSQTIIVDQFPTVPWQIVCSPTELDCLNTALAADPNNSAALRARAELETSANQLDAALADTQHLADLSPDKGYVNFRLGLIVFSKNQPDTALGYLNQSIDAGYDCACVFIYRAKAYAALGKPAEALADFQTAIDRIQKVDVSGYNPWLDRAQFYILQGKPDLALPDLDMAESRWPKSSDVYIARGQALGALKREPEALAAFDHAIAMAPCGCGVLDRGLYYASTNQFDLALADYNAADKAMPNNWAVFYDRGDLYLNHGDFALAVDQYKQSLKLYPANANAWAGLCRAYSGLKRPAVAADACTRGLEIDPNSYYARSNRGPAYMDDGQFDKAIADFQIVLAVSPGDAGMWQKLGDAQFITGRYAAAVDSLSTSLKLCPCNAPALYERARAYDILGQPDKALADLDSAIAIDAGRTEYHALRGDVLVDLRRPDEAIEAYTHALALSSFNPDALVARGNVYYSLKDWSHALADYQQYLSLGRDGVPGLTAIITSRVAELKTLAGQK